MPAAMGKAICKMFLTRWRGKVKKKARGGGHNKKKSDGVGGRGGVPAALLAGFHLRSERFAIEGDRSTSRDVGCRCGTATVWEASNCVRVISARTAADAGI